MTTMRSHDAIRDFQFTKDSLKDKIILVTGAGDGIGKVAALTYAKCGATVLLLGKTQSNLKRFMMKLRHLGWRCLPFYPWILSGQILHRCKSWQA